jgi:threonine aldolase
MSEIVDLRSDTVTKPSADMRAAIASAEVGDDVHGDDPTVNALQARAAELLGQETALYVPSGSMANQIAIHCVCEPGDELIFDVATHTFNYETGAAAALSGVSMRTVQGTRGIYTADDVRAVLRAKSIHAPNSRMIVVENTNNTGGGSVWPQEKLAGIRAVADEHGLHVHLDGARLMNACVAAGCKPTDFTQYVDTVSMCFSKGLGAPVGSVIAGSKAFFERAVRCRKMFGGAMRQAGLLAAGALYALDHNVERLAEDHANAKRLAQALAETPGFEIDPATVETNIVIFQVDPRLGTGAEMQARLESHGVWMFSMGPQMMRAVTHLDVSSAQVDRAIEVFREIGRTSPAA